MQSDLTYWLVMAFLALVVIVAIGGTTAYAYFSEDRWGRPRERAIEPAQEEVATQTPVSEDIAA